MKMLLKLVLLSSLALAFTAAYSHGVSEPQHGGIVEAAGDMSIELVTRDGRVEVYLTDDGEGVSTKGMSGKVKVDGPDGSYDITLEPAGDNSFSASGVSIPKGSEALILITLANGYSKIAAKFTID